ncbi:MAG: zf-HC2 domain-containing protein [Clostridiales bacterium]|nr:zf-HC2 domain-containing protein [Clostridiales bacterium]
MNCNVVKDLMPLLIDDCCSEESAKLVKDHIEKCEECRKEYAEMTSAENAITYPAKAPEKLGSINVLKASVFQSLALFVSFAIITLGVALEAKTPAGHLNGFWLFALIIPAAAFLLSLANLYFIKSYPTKRTFMSGSVLITLFFAAAAFVWGLVHYGAFTGINVFAAVPRSVLCMGIGIVLTAAACILAAMLSSVYAKSLGKE